MEIRSFIAVEATEELIARLAALLQALRESGADVGWVAPESLHVTLRFLGNVDETRIPGLTDALSAIAECHAPFTVWVAGVGAFPSVKRPRVIWAGVTEHADLLVALAAEVEAALARVGFPPEERAFRAHITLGRVKSPRGLERLTPMLARHAEDDFGTMPVSAISVMRSDLTPRGARYTALARLPLTGGDNVS